MTTALSIRASEVRSLTGRATLRGHVAIARVDHWFKQVFILPGIAAALSDGTTDVPGGVLPRLALGLVSTCLIASSNYVINEVLDAPSDKHHPVKSARPVPSGLVNVRLAYVQWIALMAVGLALGFVVGTAFGLTMLALWVMGCIYNIPPLRSKDVPYLDVLSESINNPLRMMAGWYMTGVTALAPTSLLVSYWMVGCYFMAIKRYSEYVEIGDPARAASYRKSFSHYTPNRLLISIVFYASAAMLFLGAFVMRYRLELILTFPLIAVVMAIYLGLAFRPGGAAINPERLYRERPLMTATIVCAAAMLVFMWVDVPLLDEIFRPTGLRIRS
jgi:decaprenyl-phosphate phosphoribosyltransferase